MNLNVTVTPYIKTISGNSLEVMPIDAVIKNIVMNPDYTKFPNHSGLRGGKLNTEVIRQATTHEKQNELKMDFLPAVAVNGVFNEITNRGLTHYSNVTAMDFDQFHSEADLQGIMLRLKATPFVLAAFRTPSGNGLKAIVLHDNDDPTHHADLYSQLLVRFQDVDKVATLDRSCSDLRRLHYLPYDPDAYINPAPVPYHYVPTVTQIQQAGAVKGLPATTASFISTLGAATPTVKSMPTPCAIDISDQSILNILKARCKRYHPEYFHEGARRKLAYWMGLECCILGVDYITGLEFTVNLITGPEVFCTPGNEMPQSEIIQNFSNGHKNGIYNEDARLKIGTKQP
jgi:hypothetical protein